jgi:hypothetical protein
VAKGEWKNTTALVDAAISILNQWSSMTDEDAPSWEAFKSLQEDNPALWLALTQPDGDEWFRKLPLASVYPPLGLQSQKLP